MRYHHVQHAPIWLAGLIGVIALAALVPMFVVDDVGTGPRLGFSALIIGILFIAMIFRRLTVEVGGDEVRASFGFGWPSRGVARSDIADVRTVRNRWFYGLGIRKVPKGWMFNVWGLDAVELELRSGRVFRIGSDEPDVLAATLERSVHR